MGVRWHVESRLESRWVCLSLWCVVCARGGGRSVGQCIAARDRRARARRLRFGSGVAGSSASQSHLSLSVASVGRPSNHPRRGVPPARLCSLFSSPSVPYSTLGDLTERRSESGVCGNDRIPAVSRNRRAVARSVSLAYSTRVPQPDSSHRAQASSTQGLYTRLKKCAKALRASRSSRSGSSYSCACSCSWAARRCASSRAPPSLRYPSWRRSPHGAHGCPNGW